MIKIKSIINELITFWPDEKFAQKLNIPIEAAKFIRHAIFRFYWSETGQEMLNGLQNIIDRKEKKQ